LYFIFFIEFVKYYEHLLDLSKIFFASLKNL